jgi:TM2 domain-containing membrane protein YozV
MFDSQFMALPGITPQEYTYLQTATNGLNEQQLRTFLMIYSGKRKSPSDILLFTLLAFVGIAGVQRFVMGQIGMGILYFLTGGLCLIGTVVDLINHKDLAFEHNQKMAFESLQMTRMSNF